MDDDPDGGAEAGESGKQDFSHLAMPKQKTCRYDSSLGLLTKKFVALMQSAPNGILDLNAAASHLNVQKRRIYDITNVLEGIGLIEKKSKNNIQWKGMGPNGAQDMEAQLESLKEQIHISTQHEEWLDKAIEQMQTSLRELASDTENSQHAFVTHEDIRNISSFHQDTVIAIKAPSGTTLEVPDPDEGMQSPQRRYQIYLKSHAGPVEVFLVSQLDEAEGTQADTSNADGEWGAGPGQPSSSGASKSESSAQALGDTIADADRQRKRTRNGDASAAPACAGSPARPPARERADPLLKKLSPVSFTDSDYWNSSEQPVGVNDLFPAGLKEEPAG